MSPAVTTTDDESAHPLRGVDRANTILYCRHWPATVRFYRDELGLDVVHDTDWFVEFRLTGESYVSIADAARATIDDVGGQGITLSLHVADLSTTRRRLIERGLSPSEMRTVWSATACYLFDPEGHRIELWTESLPP